MIWRPRARAEENMSDEEKARVRKYEETGNAEEAAEAVRINAMGATVVNKVAAAPAKKK